jgi:hypothetical protein
MAEWSKAVLSLLPTPTWSYVAGGTHVAAGQQGGWTSHLLQKDCKCSGRIGADGIQGLPSKRSVSAGTPFLRVVDR